MAIAYSSQRLGLRLVPVGVCLIWIGGGILQLLIVAGGALLTYTYIRQVYDILSPAVRQGMPDERVAMMFFSAFVHLVIVVPVLLAGLGGGLKLVLQGLGKLLIPQMPANIPYDYEKMDEVKNGFSKRSLNLYSQQAPNSIAKWLGYTTLFLPPSAYGVVDRLGHSVQSRAGKLIGGGVLLAMVLGFVALMGGAQGSLPAAIRPLLDVPNKIQLILPILVMMGLHIVLAIVESSAVMILVPRLQPNTVAHEATEVYRGFGHPEQLLARLPELEIPLRWQEFLNRTRIDHVAEQASAAVGDVGTFSAGVMVEQQPQPIPTPGRTAGYLLYLAGWSFSLLSYVAILLVIYMPQLALDRLSTPIFIVLLGFLALAAGRGGGFLRTQGQALLMAYHFRSTAIYFELIGNIFRSDVRMGKGMLDSIESSNVAVRSDFTVRFWAAEMISEAPTLLSPRSLLALNQTDEAAYWLQYFRSGLHKLRSEGVRPMGVDLVSDEAQNIVQANVGVAALRAGAMEKAQLQAAQEVQQGQLKPGAAQPGMPLFPVPVADSQPNRICPVCGQPVRAQARFCQGCGHSLS
jgi:hypothetical protein